jgi:hypothetical protein
MIFTTLEDVATLADSVWNLEGVTVGTLNTTVDYKYTLSFGTPVVTEESCTIPTTIANDAALYVGELVAVLDAELDLVIALELSGIIQQILQIDKEPTLLSIYFDIDDFEKYTLNV